MKFKFLVVTFNIVLIVSFLIVFFTPFFALDAGFMAEFWLRNWYLAAVFLLLIAGVNLLFVLNGRTLILLEREDWPALAAHLERQVFDRGRLTRRTVRLLCDALILLADFQAIGRLEALLASKRPRLLDSLGPHFAAARLLAGDYPGLESFASQERFRTGPDADWMGFFLGFARQMGKKDAVDALVALTRKARDPIVVALAGYLAGGAVARGNPARAEEARAAAAEARERVLARFSRSRWDRAVEEARAQMYVVMVGKLLDEAGAWLFA